MGYATQTDMVSYLGEREVIAITDRNFTGAIDPTVLATALDLASEEMDAYLEVRFALPLARVPRLLSLLCCDIARYRLCGTDAQETDPTRVRYRDALKTLTLIKDGSLTFGLDPLQQEVGTRATVQILDGRRVFSKDSLADY